MNSDNQKKDNTKKEKSENDDSEKRNFGKRTIRCHFGSSLTLLRHQAALFEPCRQLARTVWLRVGVQLALEHVVPPLTQPAVDVMDALPCGSRRRRDEAAHGHEGGVGSRFGGADVVDHVREVADARDAGDGVGQVDHLSVAGDGGADEVAQVREDVGSLPGDADAAAGIIVL